MSVLAFAAIVGVSASGEVDTLLQTLDLADYVAEFANAGHVSVESLAALPASEIGLLCGELGLTTRETRKLAKELRKTVAPPPPPPPPPPRPPPPPQ